MDENEEIQEGMYVGTILTPSNPVDIKDAFKILVDWVTGEAGKANDILDWGTFNVESTAALNPDTGQELIYFNVKVRAIGVGFPDAE